MFHFQKVEFKNIVRVEELALTKQTTLITGPSGGGKTTLLRLMNKLISPTAGVLTYRGEDLSKIPSVLHRRRVLMLSQQALLFEGTVRENLSRVFTSRKEFPRMTRCFAQPSTGSNSRRH